MENKVYVEFDSNLAMAHVFVPESLVPHATLALEKVGYNADFTNSGNGHQYGNGNGKIIETCIAVIPLHDQAAIEHDIRAFREYLADLTPGLGFEIKDVSSDTRFF